MAAAEVLFFPSSKWTALMLSLLWALLLHHRPIWGLNADRYALMAFKASISSDPYSSLRDWSDDSPLHCNWNGIRCDHEHRVVWLNLPDCSLSGSIPKDLQALSQLQRINLRNNSFSGPIPEEIDRISTLHKIMLGSNRLSGNLPQGLGNLSNLELLDVSRNLLEGTIPAGLGHTKLELLNVSGNMLSGNIPEDLGSASRQAVLDLAANNFEGEVPHDLQWVPPAAFAGNPNLCGPPLANPCGEARAVPPVADSIPPVGGKEPPEFSPLGGIQLAPKSGNGGRLSVKEILAIAVGDAVGILLLGLVFIYCFRRNKLCDYVKRRRSRNRNHALNRDNPPSDSDSSSISHSDCCLWLYCCCCCCNVEGSEWLAEDSGTEGELVLFEMDKNDRLTFDLEDLLRASAYVISKGGSGGIVYKAVLESGVTLAVRRLAGDGSTATGNRKQKEFDAEVQIVGRIRHPCIVKLRAYYSGPDEKLLVYDYIANGSLATALHGEMAPYSLTSLTWTERVKIARRVAEGLAHIHECGPRKYIHGDIRPKNILLSSNMEAYISDFGLSRLITISGSANNSRSGSRNANSSASLAAVSQQQGSSSLGINSGVSVEAGEIKDEEEENEAYRPPESRLTGAKPTQKWDVYAFGVVMLELISGKSATQHLKQQHRQQLRQQHQQMHQQQIQQQIQQNPNPNPQQQEQAPSTVAASSLNKDKDNSSTSTSTMPLVEWARKMWEGKRPVYELLDPTLMHGIAPQQRDVAEFLQIALNCVVSSAEQRPKMKQVSDSLKRIGS